MKKLAILLALVLAGGISSAQKAVMFRIKFLPTHLYKVTTDMNMGIQTILPAGTDAPGKNMDVKNVTLQQFTITTGASVAGGGFPYAIKYDTISTKMTVNGAEKDLPIHIKAGSLFNGWCTADGKMHVDSIPGAQVNPPAEKTGSPDAQPNPIVKASIKEMINKLIDAVKFPDKPLTVGESFTQDMPMPLPMIGNGSNITVKCTYKLTDIKKKLAYFDVNMDMNITVDKPNLGNNNSMSVKATGHGAGKMVYDIDKNFPVENNSDMNMQMDMTVNSNINMHANMKGAFSSKTEISAN